MDKAFFGLSDIGYRPNNEDVWKAIPEIGFFAIADGMGGHNAGEIAAQEAIDHISSSFKKIKSTDCVELIIELRHAIEQANLWVHRLSKKNESLFGMGTTLCCLIWTAEKIIYAHVGDSRIYRLRGQKLELLTQDHSLLTRFQKISKKTETPYPYKNVITRAVGTAQKANPEIAFTSHLPGDLFFLCTDGLSDVLNLDEIQKIITHSKDLQTACENLIEEAKIKGSSDNITILMVQSENGKNLFRQQRDDSLGPESLQGHAPRS
jgi:serine/threonine protein phosphatase PrpC